MMATKQKVVVEGSSFTASQMQEFWRQSADGSLTREHLNALLEHKNPFEPKSLPKVSSGPRQSEQKSIFNLWLSRLPEFWEKFAGLKISLSIFEIPKKLPSRFAWPIYRPAGFNNGDAVELCKKQFPVWEGVNIRDCTDAKGPDKPQLLIVRPTVEPDEEYLGKSADDLVATGKLFLDVGTRSILEAQFHFMTSNHLDVRGWTRCPTSRFQDVFVALVYWRADFGMFGLDWDDPDGVLPFAGGREAVSLSLKT